MSRPLFLGNSITIVEKRQYHLLTLNFGSDQV